MVDGGFSSPRSDGFPAGLRVLVVDDDPAWLRILEKMLKKCSYEVTTCCLARDALSLLRERKHGFDIVISDVNMPDMDGFKLLEHVGLEMDLPVIMMSVDGETSRVMKGVQHGACDYLLKPIRMKELRNIWQHVFRKKIHEVRDIENLEGIESIQMARCSSEQADNGLFLSGEDMSRVKKRKDFENKHDESDLFDSSSTKKARVVWSVDLHQKFVKAVNQIGLDKVGPKKILDLMNVPWLTRENVASHLQKYRLYLSRLPRERDLKNFVGGIKHSDSPPKESEGSCSLQNSINMLQNDRSDHSYGFPVGNSTVQNMDRKGHEGECKGNNVFNETKQKRAFPVDVPDPPHKAKSSEGLFIHSSTSFGLGTSLPSFSSSITTQYSWNDVPVVQLKQETQPFQSDNGFSELSLPAAPNQVLAEYLQPASSINVGSSMIERDTSSSTDVKLLSNECRVNHVKHSSPTVSVDLFPVESKNPVPNVQVLEPIPVTTISNKNPSLNENFLADLGSLQKNFNWGVETPFISLDEELEFCLRQGDCYAMNLGHQGIGFTAYNDATMVTEIPFHLYDAVRFDYGNLFDPTEISTIDQGSCCVVPTHLW